MGDVDRNKLLLEFEKLIDRLIRAEKWARDKNYTWEFVKASKYKIWHERDNIIKEIEFVRELLKNNKIKSYECILFYIITHNIYEVII